MKKSNNDGGKGSSPRPYSVSQAEYDARWDAIFGRDVENELDDEDIDGYICPDCSGSGEGQHEGSTCRTCGGSGGWARNSDDGDDSDYER